MEHSLGTSVEPMPTRLYARVDWLGDYHFPCKASVIADRGDPYVALMFYASGFTITPPSLQPRAARELAAALIAAADLIEGQGAQS